ncbi:MAG TPA: serine/threonine-protein kinase [Polyangiaceae bacterium]|jgi:serine/threonine-protein kinase|nr:serine/threonine-protein kinase [Polyangiaceae bacterium]
MSKSPSWEVLDSSELVPVPDETLELPFSAGDIIGAKYEVKRLIGTGGMGFVVSALHMELGETVALKFLRPQAMSNPEIVGRFSREAQASVRIKSEYVARVFDVGSLDDGTPFIVMEYLEGTDLCDLLRVERSLPVKRAVEYVMQTCEALAAAHVLGVVHRDIKPENLFLTHRAQGVDIIKVLDFGISKVALTGSAFDSGVPLVRTMAPLGSPVYMSPEQIRGVEVDARTDIWSLGCVLFELLTGTAAFDAPSLMQLSATILEKDPPPLRSRLADAPPELEAIVRRCLAKDRNDRFESVAELAIALYPFGPRRARISAERCYYLLKGSSPRDDFELATIPPPSALRDSTPTSMDPAISAGPSAMSVGNGGQRGRSSGWRSALLAGAALLVAAGGYGAARVHAAGSEANGTDGSSHLAARPSLQNDGIDSASKSGASEAPPAPRLAAATATVDPSADPSGRPAAAAGTRAAATTAAFKRTTHVDLSKLKRPAGKTSAHGGDEPDVGF